MSAEIISLILGLSATGLVAAVYPFVRRIIAVRRAIDRTRRVNLPDISASGDITISYGFTAEQVRELIGAAATDLARRGSELEDANARLRAPQGAINSALAALEHADLMASTHNGAILRRVKQTLEETREEQTVNPTRLEN